jgi:3-deoxy-7-phosphoheptulonate synthase
MKNPTSGDFGVMLNSIQAAQIPHEFIYNGWEVQTKGNYLSHAILRGAFNQYGHNIPNYHFEDLHYLMKMYLDRGLENPAVLVDCNHANSGKRFLEQPRIAMEVLASRKKSDILKNSVKGLLIESYLVEGTQSISEGTYGKSITDPCLGWEDSEKLILEIADHV